MPQVSRLRQGHETLRKILGHTYINIYRHDALLSKSFIPDPLFLSSQNGHKNHLRKIWSEKCPFFAIYENI